jgi:hypothetical protein
MSFFRLIERASRFTSTGNLTPTDSRYGTLSSPSPSMGRGQGVRSLLCRGLMPGLLLLSFPGCATPLQIKTKVLPTQRLEGPVERRPEHDIVVADVVRIHENIEIAVSNLQSCEKTTLERQEIVTHRKRELSEGRAVLQVAAIVIGSLLLYSYSKIPEEPDGGNYAGFLLYGVGLTAWGSFGLFANISQMEDRYIRKVKETSLRGETFVCERIAVKGAALKLVFPDGAVVPGTTGGDGLARFPLDASLRRVLVENKGKFTLWIDGKKHTPVDLSRELPTFDAGAARSPG